MSLGNANYVAILFVSYVTGITGTVNGYAEYAACGLADVAHTSPFGLAIHLSNPEWYRNGMKILAFINGYSHNGYKWNKKTINWAIMNESTRVEKKTIVDICKKSIDTWLEAIPGVFEFHQVTSGEQPDVRILFELDVEPRQLAFVRYPYQSQSMDKDGADIVINDKINWTDENAEGYRETLPLVVLHEIGHVLGLGHSIFEKAVMYSCTVSDRILAPYHIDYDDYIGLRELYRKRLRLQ